MTIPFLLAYLLSATLFIIGIKKLTKIKTARTGNFYSAFAMVMAIVTTLIYLQMEGHGISVEFLLGGILLGSLVGMILAKKVKMTAMPELVALFNGVGGAASLMVALSVVFSAEMILSSVTNITLILSIIIGSVTLSGSLVAFRKLSGKCLLRAFPGIKFLNGLLALAILILAFLTSQTLDTPYIIALTVLALFLGIFLVAPIGGADMPVVVSLLNSYSGLAVAATGFVTENLVLVITGALVGASGLILTGIMCKAMNRSLWNVIFGNTGDTKSSQNSGKHEYENVKSTSAEEVAMILDGAEKVVIVPGYGMAVGQAQHAVKELTEALEDRGAEVLFAIHPVAGRMPGHMNVLLAEANIDYDKLKTLEQINPQFKQTDVVYVIGANDVVNPAAVEEEGSPIYGMPILEVHEARTVINVKRSLSPGFANVKNSLFERENSVMFFADAKQATEEITKELRDL